MCGKLYRHQFMLEDPEIAHVSQMEVHGLALQTRRRYVSELHLSMTQRTLSDVIL